MLMSEKEFQYFKELFEHFISCSGEKEEWFYRQLIVLMKRFEMSDDQITAYCLLIAKYVNMYCR